MRQFAVQILLSPAAQAVRDPRRYYTGLTSNLSMRLDAHNAGRCLHTAYGRKWIVDVVVEFTDERRALTMELVGSQRSQVEPLHPEGIRPVAPHVSVTPREPLGCGDLGEYPNCRRFC